MLINNKKSVAIATVKCRITESKEDYNSTRHLNITNNYREPGHKTMSN